MKFLLDENVDFLLAELLRELGHDVSAVAREHPAALKDVLTHHADQLDQYIVITQRGVRVRKFK